MIKGETCLHKNYKATFQLLATKEAIDMYIEECVKHLVPPTSRTGQATLQYVKHKAMRTHLHSSKMITAYLAVALPGVAGPAGVAGLPGVAGAAGAAAEAREGPAGVPGVAIDFRAPPTSSSSSSDHSSDPSS